MISQKKSKQLKVIKQDGAKRSVTIHLNIKAFHGIKKIIIGMHV